jgi:hypothetical protein
MCFSFLLLSVVPHLLFDQLIPPISKVWFNDKMTILSFKTVFENIASWVTKPWMLCLFLRLLLVNRKDFNFPSILKSDQACFIHSLPSASTNYISKWLDYFGKDQVAANDLSFLKVFGYFRVMVDGLLSGDDILNIDDYVLKVNVKYWLFHLL